MPTSHQIPDAELPHNRAEPSDPPEGWENWPFAGQLVDTDHMAIWVPLLWKLITADHPPEIARLEEQAGVTQTEANLFIESSCYDRDLPHLVGGNGTARDRLIALRTACAAFDARPK
jgi:hypothetical protein